MVDAVVVATAAGDDDVGGDESDTAPVGWSGWERIPNSIVASNTPVVEASVVDYP
ncbi:MAG: hypothetical protein M1835_005071 [Candelina submexicana]|nr:MAG: hypothetical protein M1835_005071 [Candelina submexicana]